MKIGLWLQNHANDNYNEFERVIGIVKKSDIDLFVFPENSYVSFQNLIDNVLSAKTSAYFKEAKKLASNINKPVVFSNKDRLGTVFSWYYNPNANKGETREQLYIKHTATLRSAFDIGTYKDGFSDSLFKPILLKGKKIGLTICYDCNYPIFSAMYGAQNIDILINSTGGNVTNDKWHRYNQVRAIENHCFNFVTMGYWYDYKKINSYVYGYNPDGKPMKYDNLMVKNAAESNLVGTVYVYDTDSKEYLSAKGNAKPKANQKQDMDIPVGKVQRLLDKAEKLDKNLYAYSFKGNTIVFCIAKDAAVLMPGEVCRLLYHDKLKKYRNKKYIVVSQWSDLSLSDYNEKIEQVLRVRSMENYCAVILESKLKNTCFQCGMNRSSQEVAAVNGNYGIDLSRTTGPEAIWKNKPKTKMRASWRDGYEWLIKNLL